MKFRSYYFICVSGMESLNAALGCFEDALATYTAGGHNNTLALTTHDEAEFVQSLQNVIDDSYALQDLCERLFLHEVFSALLILCNIFMIYYLPISLPGIFFAPLGFYHFICIEDFG